MNTILNDRLFSDPRLNRLTKLLGCPLKAIGVLGWMWHGTQNLGVCVADEATLDDSIPFGVRDRKKLQVALEDSGWIQRCDGGWRIVGNEEHVKARENLKEKGKKAADKRWGKTDGSGMGDPSEKMPNPSRSDGSAMPTHLPSSSPHLTSKEGSQPQQQKAEAAHREFEDRPKLPPQTDSLREITESAIPFDHVTKVVDAYRAALAKRGMPAPSLMILDSEKNGARKLITKCAMDPDLACEVVTAFVGDDNPWWKKKDWPLYLLADDKDFEPAKNIAMRKRPTAAKTNGNGVKVFGAANRHEPT